MQGLNPISDLKNERPNTDFVFDKKAIVKEQPTTLVRKNTTIREKPNKIKQETDISPVVEKPGEGPGVFLVNYDDDFNNLKCRYQKDSVPREIQLAVRSTFIGFTQKSKLRVYAVVLTYHSAFNNVVLICILMNTLCMALFD
jgi:hypothetical protein